MKRRTMGEMCTKALLVRVIIRAVEKEYSAPEDVVFGAGYNDYTGFWGNAERQKK